jgi:hypothetical protein
MKKELKLIWAGMASLILVAAVCAIPPTLPHSTVTLEQTAAPTQSVSGQIAEVQKTSFTLNVGPSHTMSNVRQQLQETQQKSMTFQIDKNTTIDGKMQVGANAEVTYREDGGKLVAISVRVS